MKYKRWKTSRSRWLSVAKNCPYATYFHTPYWYELMAPGQKHIAFEVQFENGASAVIPIAKIKRFGGLLTDHFSSPGGTYGGWISEAQLNGEHVKVLTGILTSRKNLTYRINPFFDLSIPTSTPSIPVTPQRGLTGDSTRILDLTKGVDSIFSGFSKGHASAIKSAGRDGVSVRAAETFEEWEKYYALYTESVERWRAGASAGPRTVYPLSLFRRIFNARAGNEILWLAVKDGEPVAGALFFYWNRHAVSWHGAASAKHFNLRPNNLLYWEIIRDAANRGYELFDFNPSGGYAGVESFKEHFGSTSAPSPVLSTRTPLRSLISRVCGRKY